MRVHLGSDLYGKASVTDKVSSSDVSKYKKVILEVSPVINLILMLILLINNGLLYLEHFL